MHKKLAADLTSLAHSILQLKNKEDVLVLKQKAYEIYEKLTVLAYVDEYINTTPNATETKEELLKKIADVVVKEVVEAPEDEAIEDAVEELLAEEEEEEGIVVEFVVEETDEHVLITFEEEEEEE
ncbi:MAG: phosphoglucomutase, partial [Polaribacter sp.]